MTCHICYLDIPTEQLEVHINICFKQQEEELNKITNKLINEESKKITPQSIRQELLKKSEKHLHDKLDKFTELQEKALTYVEKKSKIFCKNTTLDVQNRFTKLGYNESDLLGVIDYLKNNVDITININLDKILTFILQDDKYKNLFETNTSGGNKVHSIRAVWEDKLFNNIYKDATSTERVKYGALNVTNSKNGISCCRGYGDSFFILKKDVRKRTSFVIGDSSKQDVHMLNFNNCSFLFNLLDESILKEMINIANKNITNSNLLYGEYIECQIHGDLRFGSDIELLVVNNRHKSNSSMMNQINEFSQKYNCPCVFSN